MKINFSYRRLAKSLMWRFFASSDMQFRLRSGITVSVADRNEMATFQEIFIQQEYDDFLDLIPQPLTVLDLGCNSGYFGALMMNRALLKPNKTMPKMVLVDANEAAVKRAQSLLNSCAKHADISYVVGLIGRRGDSLASFFISPASAESSAINRTKHAQQIEVNCVDLAALAAQQFPAGLDLIKCDIEGGEEHLVRDWGDVLQRSKALLIEWHGFQGEWPEFCEILHHLGFQLILERPAGRYKNALFSMNQP